jgi:hypothetical protein
MYLGRYTVADLDIQQQQLYSGQYNSGYTVADLDTLMPIHNRVYIVVVSVTERQIHHDEY